MSRIYSLQSTVCYRHYLQKGGWRHFHRPKLDKEIVYLTHILTLSPSLLLLLLTGQSVDRGAAVRRLEYDGMR